MYNITQEEKDFSNKVQSDRQMFETKFASILEKGERTLNLFAEPSQLSSNYNLSNNKTFWNTARYVSIISLDLKILAKHQAFSTNEWEKRFFARQISLLIYESVDDLLFLLGKQFQKIVDSFKRDESIKEGLNQIRRKINTFKKQNYTNLQAQRNICAAHRDTDTSEQLKMIYSISWIDSVNICSEFDLIINETGQFLEKMMRQGISDGAIKFNAY